MRETHCFKHPTGIPSHITKSGLLYPNPHENTIYTTFPRIDIQLVCNYNIFLYE